METQDNDSLDFGVAQQIMDRYELNGGARTVIQDLFPRLNGLGPILADFLSDRETALAQRCRQCVGQRDYAMLGLKFEKEPLLAIINTAAYQKYVSWSGSDRMGKTVDKFQS